MCEVRLHGIIIILIIELLIFVRGNIEIKLLSKPAVFGTDVRVTCKLSDQAPCCRESTRKWSVGKSYELVVINGSPLNASKYSESLDEENFTSTLTIKKFSEQDINIPYECSYGFETATKILNLTKEEFEFHPTEFLPEKLMIDKEIALVNITFWKIYPAPACFAMEKKTDISTNLSVSNVENGLFFTTSIQFIYNVKGHCGRHILIYCSVGQTNFTVVNSTIPCGSKSVGRTETTVIAVIGLICLMTLGIVVFLISYEIIKKRRQRQRQENEAMEVEAISVENEEFLSFPPEQA